MKIKHNLKEEVKDKRNDSLISKSEEKMRVLEKVNDLSKSISILKNIYSILSKDLEVIK